MINFILINIVMKQINRVVIFIGSPSDTELERKSIPSIIEELNQTLGAAYSGAMSAR